MGISQCSSFVALLYYYSQTQNYCYQMVKREGVKAIRAEIRENMTL
jgi:hypothetical protein